MPSRRAQWRPLATRLARYALGVTRAAKLFGALVLIACEAGPETFRGITAEIDASRADGSCAARDAGPLVGQCASDDECGARFAPLAPSGTLYLFCWNSFCRAAASCVETHRGAPDYCTCGSSLTGPYGCFGSTPLCVRVQGASAPSCVAACSP